jgi:prophage antirepressor-like protein
LSSVVTIIFNDFGIRASVINGIPLFVFADVRYAVGDVCITAADLNSDERAFIELNCAGRCQRVAAVNLFGLSSVVAGSDPDVARKFKHWIAVEGLPTLLSPSTARLLQQPSSQDGLFSTTEIAEALNLHPIALGKMTKHLKNPRYGERYFAPAAYSDAVIEQWYWNSDGRAAVLREFGPSNFRPTRTI